MPEVNYSEPVSQLLSFGDPREIPGEVNWLGETGWPDYLSKFGLAPEHVPELVRMVTDQELDQAPGDTPEVWAPLHAWRALGQLKTEAAIQPLVGILVRADNDDSLMTELPVVMGMIGPAAVAPVAKYLNNTQNKSWPRVTAADSLAKIGEAHPQTRPDCIQALMAALENFASNDEELNAFLISSLADLDAVEAAPLVEQAYKADRVDESIFGDWEDYQVEVGLLEERITDPDEDLDFNPYFPANFGEPLKHTGKKEDKQVKKKRKQAKESRKKNRKKKK